MVAMIWALALQAATPPAVEANPATPQQQHPAEGAMHGLLKLFDGLCNQVFPDDARLAALDRVPNMKPLTPEELRVYLKNDPGRGWITADGANRIVITIEAPPFHACAVRMLNTDGMIDEGMWRQLVGAAEAKSGGTFVPMPQQSFVVGGVRSTVIGDQKANPDRSSEAFYLFRTTPVDPAKVAGYGVELRLVHQFAAPGAR